MGCGRAGDTAPSNIVDMWGEMGHCHGGCVPGRGDFMHIKSVLGL